MNATIIETGISQQLAVRSGLDLHRAYLGISKVTAECPRKAVREYYSGITPTDQAHRMCFAGYEHENSILELLVKAGLAKAQVCEVVAPYDERLRGHTDALTVEDDLLEIKSVDSTKFAIVCKTNKALQKHFMQVQLYMRYAPKEYPWSQAFIVYRSREFYEHRVIRVPYVPIQAERAENKALMMLRYIDRHELPSCECGRCK